MKTHNTENCESLSIQELDTLAPQKDLKFIMQIAQSHTVGTTLQTNNVTTGNSDISTTAKSMRMVIEKNNCT